MRGVFDIAAQVQDWLKEGRDVRVATVVETQGFSSRVPASSAAWTDGLPAVGELVEGVTPGQFNGEGLSDITISQDEAVGAGLACGGTATIMHRSAADYPAHLWDLLIDREPVCLVTPIKDGEVGATELFTQRTVRDAALFGDDIPRLFGRGLTTAANLGNAIVIALWPVPTMVVMGAGQIANALGHAGALLGWNTQIVPEVQAAVAAVAELSPSDAVVVLSHDRADDGPTLAAALSGRAGYIGALGSRRTQVARREWLTEHRIPAEVQARIHGPAGLDLGAHTAGEIAISIVAEILASRSASAGGALRDRTGPVHLSG